MGLATINENSTSWLELSFFDKVGLPESPVSISYRIDCLTNGAEVRADTALAAGSSVEVELTTADNAIITQTNKEEHRRVTVTASYGSGQAHIERFDYMVQNLRAVS